MSFNLEHALEDLAEAGASRRTADDDALVGRVGLMAARIRRRRALRYTGTTVVAACAVGALAVGVAYLPGLLDRGPTPPATSPSPSATPTPSEEPSADPTADVEPLPPELAGFCGQPVAAIEDLLRSQVPVALGSASVLSVDETEPSLASYQYSIPQGTEQLETTWHFVVSHEGTVVAVAAAPQVGGPSSTQGATSTEIEATVPTDSCVYDGVVEPGLAELQVVVSATLVGVDGEVRHDRVMSEPFEFVLPGASAQDPVAQAFVCGQPGPDSIHTLPDAGGLTLAVDLPASPWNPAELPEIPGFIGSTDGQTILANIGQGVSGALVDAQGLVAGFVSADSGDVWLAEIGPDAPAEVQTPQILTVCGPDGELEYLQSLTGTYTLWPFVTGVLKEVTDAEGNATTPSADPVIVIANPQDVTFAP